jgi:hypothetical protein
MTPTHIFGYPAQLLLTNGGTRLDVTPALRPAIQRHTVEIDLPTVKRMMNESAAYFPPRRGISDFGSVDFARIQTATITANTITADPIIQRRVYRSGGWQDWVTRQGALWVDREGNVLLISRMPKDYCLNVIQFLYENHEDDIYPTRTNPLLQALRKRVLEA